MRASYRRNYPLTAESQADRAFNPGAGWVLALCFEPKVGRAVLEALLAPWVSAGRILLVLHHRPVAVECCGDLVRAVTLKSTRGGGLLTVAADYVLEALAAGRHRRGGRLAGRAARPAGAGESYQRPCDSDAGSRSIRAAVPE